MSELRGKGKQGNTTTAVGAQHAAPHMYQRKRKMIIFGAITLACHIERVPEHSKTTIVLAGR